MFTTAISESPPVDAGYLRRKAVVFRQLASDHADAGSPEIAKKLSEFVAELEAKADKLDASIH